MPAVTTRTALEKATAVLDQYDGKSGILIPVLQALQEEFGYLPEPALSYTAEKTGVPLAEVLRVATFYASFSLEPQGEHLICVCMGTACHVKGAPRILEALRRELGLVEGQQTSDDMKFTIRPVRCIGCCSLAPAITIDQDAHGRLTPGQIPKILSKL